jgi:dTDP-4-dehydrorhamnose reductase
MKKIKSLLILLLLISGGGDGILFPSLGSVLYFRKIKILTVKFDPIEASDIKEAIIGIDIGGTKIALGIVDPAGSLTYRLEFPTPVGLDVEKVVDFITDRIILLLQKSGLPSEKIKYIGIGFPGDIGCDGTVKTAPNLPMFIGTDPKELIGQSICQKIGWPINVYMENDASAAALAEAKYGAGAGRDMFTYLTISTGIGGATVNHDVITNIEPGLYIYPDPEQPDVPLIDLASGKAITKQAKETILSYIQKHGENDLQNLTKVFQLVKIPGDTIIEKIGNLTAKEIAQAAQLGDVFSKSLFRKAGRYIGLAIIQLIEDEFPEKAFILGGSVLKAGSALWDAIVETIEEEKAKAGASSKLINFDVYKDLIIACVDEKERGILGASLITPTFTVVSRQEISKFQMILQNYNNLILVNTRDDSGQIAKAFEAIIRNKKLKDIQTLKFLDLESIYKENPEDFPKMASELISELNKSEYKQLIFIGGIELLTLEDELINNFKRLLVNPNINIFGNTTFQGYKKLEEDKELVAKINFVIKEKKPDEELQDKKILIIGATGFIGKNLFLKLSQYFQTVVGTSYTSGEFEYLDLKDHQQIEELLESYNPDIIIYAARSEGGIDSAESDPAQAWAINAEAIKFIANYFHGKFVYISSDYVFDGNQPPYTIYSQPNPLNIYGETKVAGEEIVKEKFDDYLIIRSGLMFGYGNVGDKPDFFKMVLDALKGRKNIKVDNVNIRHPVLVDDVSRLILKLISHRARGVYQINGKESLTYYEFACLIAKAFAELFDLTPEEAFSYIKGERLVQKASRPYDPHLINSDIPRDLETALQFIKSQILEKE